jgi:glycosyltransferase involved in cell wall biosynthesis
MSSNPRPRWLIIAHAFNMDGRAASQTITDKLRHLQSAGIEIVVLSGVSGRHDPDVEHHQLWPMGPAGFRFELRHVLHKRWGNGYMYRLCMTLASIFLLPWMLIEKLLRPVESSWSWWLSAYIKGRYLTRQKPFDLIYSTGGAFAAHSAACALKHATGTPWLAEVHDPMVIPGKIPVTAQEKMQAKIEGEICSNSDVAIWFTEQALASARQRHPQLGERGKMILPGIDNPFQTMATYHPGNKFIIGHFGSLSPTRHLGPILGALEQLFDQRQELRGVVELHVYGGPLDKVSKSILASSNAQHCLRHFGRIEADPLTGLSGRQSILKRMRSVDVLLLLHGEDAICAEYIPSKLYEYLWMARPILAVVHNNPQMAEIVRSQGHQAICSEKKESQGSSEYPGLASALSELIDNWRDGVVKSDERVNLFTTEAAVEQVLGWVGNLQRTRPSR